MYYNELIALFPPDLQNSFIIRKLIESIGLKLDSSKSSQDDLILQLSPSTATWGLSIWEEMSGIFVDKNINIETRRQRIIAKLSEVQIITPNNMKNTIQRFTDGFVNLTQQHASYSFNINLDIKNQPINFLDLENTIERIKPAHLDYSMSTNLSPTNKGIYVGACSISGETITIYPKEV